MKSTIFLALSLLGGCLIPFQAAINSILGKNYGSPFLAAATSTFISFTSLILIIIITKQSIILPSNSSWWVIITGGLIGAFIVLISLMSAPIIGVTTLFTALLLGQLFASLLIDHYGILGLSIRTINVEKISGAIFLIIGFYLIRKSSS